MLLVAYQKINSIFTSHNFAAKVFWHLVLQ